MASSHVAHNCVVGDEAIFANLATIGGHVHVGKGAFLGGMSVYHQNIRIGEYVIVSGFSGCRMDIPPFAKAAGYPAALHGANVVGLKRRGFSKEELANIRSAYKLIQSKTTTMTNVANILEAEYPRVRITEETRQYIIDHPEKFINCDVRIRAGKIYTDEEFDKMVIESLNRPLPGEEGPSLRRK